MKDDGMRMRMREVLPGRSTYIYSPTLRGLNHSDNAMYAFVARQ